jgi:hypothetical protein
VKTRIPDSFEMRQVDSKMDNMDGCADRGADMTAPLCVKFIFFHEHQHALLRDSQYILASNEDRRWYQWRGEYGEWVCKRPHCDRDLLCLGMILDWDVRAPTKVIIITRIFYSNNFQLTNTKVTI